MRAFPGFSFPLLLVLACLPAAASATDAAAAPQREMNFTGPLVTGGPPLPQGVLVVEPYFIQTQVTGRYDSAGKRRDVDGVADDWRIALPITYGITDRLTVAATLRGIHASGADGDRRWAAGDTTLTGQYLLFQGKQGARPSLAVGVRQNMPTGRHDQLDRRGLADATGSGAAFTSLALYGQAFLLPERNLRMRLGAQYRIPGAGVSVRGRSGYGTDAAFSGRAHLGSAFQGTLGAEYSFNPRWVLAGDVLYEREQGATLRQQTRTATGLARQEALQRASAWRVSVAPALEYHPSSKVGIIGGVLVSLDGRNSAELLSPQLAVNMAF